MSLSKFESEVKLVNRGREVAYSRLSDLRNLEGLKTGLSDPAVRERLSSQVPADKLESMAKYVEGMTFTEDSISISSPVGDITLRLVEREEPKLLKFASEGGPLPLYLWVQLLPKGDEQSLMRVTVGTEVNFFMKGMVAKPLQQAADGLASMLSQVGGF